MNFECPQCHQHLIADASNAGQVVRCPACNTRLQIPKIESPQPSSPKPGAQPGRSKPGSAPSPQGSPQKQAAQKQAPQKTESKGRGWKETDPTNPNMMVSLGIGFGLLVIWYLFLLPFKASPKVAVGDYSTMQYVAGLFYSHFLVSMLNTFFFCWSMAILYLKHEKLKHQKAALLLDVLPLDLGKNISAANVGQFIEHLYALPKKLRDSMMVNRIRKGLELFEIRQNSSDVREMMVSQSEIDAARIAGSFTLVRAFLWAIPLLGFIGTVIGLSTAISGMSFSNVEDVSKIVKSINNVTSGLGSAFDATLLGLVLAMALNFPMNSLVKQEDDTLSSIDAFCNEVLLPRLKDTPREGGESEAAMLTIVETLRETQEGFLRDINELSQGMKEQVAGLDRRMDELQKTLTEQLVAKTDAACGRMQGSAENAVKQSMEQVAKHIGGLESGINSLNKVLAELGGKQVVINVTKKKGWFSRD